MEKLIKKINDRLDSLNDEKIDSFYKTCIDCFNKESVKPYDKLRADYKAIYTYLLIINEIGIENSEKVRSLIDKCSLFFCNNRYTNQLYEEYYDWLELLYKNNKLYLLDAKDFDDEEFDIKNAIANLNFANGFLKEKLFYISKEDTIDDDLDNMKNNSWIFQQFISKNDDPILAIIELFKLCPKKEVFKQFLEVNDIVDIYESIKNDELFALAIKCYSKNKINKDINAFVERIIKEKNYNIYDNKFKINKYYMNLTKDIKNKNTINNKIRKNYNVLITFLKNNNNYINDIDKYLELIEDEEILNGFLNYVIMFNSKYNKNIETENTDLKKRQVSSLALLFNKYNYDFNKLEEKEKKLFQSIENLEEKLKSLNESSLDFVNTTSLVFIPLIINFSVKQISLIDNLYKNEIIDETFLNENIMDLSNKDLFFNFLSNIELLKNIGLDRISRYNRNIFLEDHDLISKRYKLFVDHYKMPTENIYNFEFLENDCIFDMIDNFIELGYLEQIRLNPDYLISRNFLMIKRLEIAKLIDMTVINSDNSFVGSIVSGNNFYVNDDMLDEFLIDYKDLYLKSNALDNVSRIDILDNSLDALFDYQEDEFTYKIGDTKLSRNRILRNLTAVDNDNLKEDLFYCILYGAVNLTEEEILDISRVCGHKTKVK